MVYLTSFIAALATASVASASLVAQARRAIEERQSSGLNAVQNWANNYATETFNTGANGEFDVVWNNGPAGDFVVGRGYQPARDMLLNYTGTFHTTGNAYLALYGWTMNPLVEYYVIEALGTHNPSDNVSATQYGCLQSDGGTYEIWQKERINAPSIAGDNTNFQQYWSIRTSMRTGGTINTGNHFRAWESVGLPIGSNNLYFDMVIEGQAGAGSATVTVQYNDHNDVGRVKLHVSQLYDTNYNAKQHDDYDNYVATDFSNDLDCAFDDLDDEHYIVRYSELYFEADYYYQIDNDNQEDHDHLPPLRPVLLLSKRMKLKA